MEFSRLDMTQPPLRNFPKTHPFWRIHLSLTVAAHTCWNQGSQDSDHIPRYCKYMMHIYSVTNMMSPCSILQRSEPFLTPVYGMTSKGALYTVYSEMDKYVTFLLFPHSYFICKRELLLNQSHNILDKMHLASSNE